jgi:hypothetical protein
MTTRIVAPSHHATVATLKNHSISSRRRFYRAMRASETKTSALYAQNDDEEEEEEEEIDRTRFSSAKRRGEERCSTSEETEMNNNNNINARVFVEDAGKKAQSMVLASAMALVLNGGVADDRFATANAMVSSSSSSSKEGKEYARSFDETARRRRTFDIAEASSSEQQASDAAATETNTSANIKPELGQGFFKDLEIFIEREPPIAVGFLFLFLINGVWGVIFTLFIRETKAGPGGEFGKGLAALRKEIVKGIFKFFGGALGRFTK